MNNIDITKKYQTRDGREVVRLKKGLANMTYSNASYHEMAATWREAAVERDALKKENELLKGIERQRWEGVNKVFGTRYSTVSDQFKNMPMNADDHVDNFGARRPRVP